MSVRLAALSLALLLALAFAAAGDLVLRRRSRSLLDLNESFLAGLGLSTLALFPLSLLVPRHALMALLTLLGIAAVTWWKQRPAIHERAPASRSATRRAVPRGDWPAAALVAAVGLAWLCFAALDLRYAYLWDGFQIWASKAMVLFHQGGLVRELWPDAGYDGRLVNYPNLVPMYEALLARLRGTFELAALKAVFLVFFSSLLLSTYAATAELASRRAALVATLLVGSTPLLATEYAAGGYADMPLAAFVTGTFAAAARARAWNPSERRTLACLLGSCLLVKDEGLVLLIAVALALAVFALLRAPSSSLRSLFADPLAAALLAAFVAERLLYPVWTGFRDTTYGPLDPAHLALAAARLGIVLTRCAQLAFDVHAWGLLWPAFALAAIFLARRGSPLTRRVTLALVFAVAGYVSALLFTNWDAALHVDQAFSRLLAQVAPVAVVLIVHAHAIVFGADTPTHESLATARAAARVPG